MTKRVNFERKSVDLDNQELGTKQSKPKNNSSIATSSAASTLKNGALNAHSPQPNPTPTIETPPSDPRLESEILQFGKDIFKAIAKESPSTFDMSFWSGKMMQWSMDQPELKVNMFRLVDVLPALRTSEAIVTHVNEYLGDAGKDIHGLVDWGLNVDPKSVRAKITAAVVKKSVAQMAGQFIVGNSPKDALKTLRGIRKDGLSFTVDLLGEFAVSEKECEEYKNRYIEALHIFGKQVPKWKESKTLIEDHPGEISPICISVKLTALYSQCSSLNIARSILVLSERLSEIVRKAKEVGAIVYVDAEDTANNEIIYETFKNVFGSKEFKDYPYPGIVIQAYAKESEKTVREMIAFAKERGGPVAVRLVKGAYWDYETIISDQNDWESPLYSQKESSDAQFEHLSRVLLDNIDHVLPAFGSHNIRSLSQACCYAQEKGISKKQFEIQVLFGMADPIALAFAKQDFLVRQYAPMGELIPGMGYLIRRLLENTSNESFLKHTFHDNNSTEQLLARPYFKD